MQDRGNLAALFGQKPQSKSDLTETVKNVTYHLKDGSTREFKEVSNEEVSLLSMYSLIDDSVEKTTIEITYQRPGA